MKAEDVSMRVFALTSVLICGLVACATVLTSGLQVPFEENDSDGIAINPVSSGDDNRTHNWSGRITISLDISVVASRPACLCIGVQEMIRYSLVVTEITGIEKLSLESVFLSILNWNGTKGFTSVSLESLHLEFNDDLKVGFGDRDSDGFLSVGDVMYIDAQRYRGLTFILHDGDSSYVWGDNYCLYYLFDWQS